MRNVVLFVSNQIYRIRFLFELNAPFGKGLEQLVSSRVKKFTASCSNMAQ